LVCVYGSLIDLCMCAAVMICATYIVSQKSSHL